MVAERETSAVEIAVFAGQWNWRQHPFVGGPRSLHQSQFGGAEPRLSGAAR